MENNYAQGGLKIYNEKLKGLMMLHLFIIVVAPLSFNEVVRDER